MRFVYSPDYYCDIGDHVFRTDKYRLLRDRIVEGGLAGPDDFMAPEPASADDLGLVHKGTYLRDLFAYEHTRRTVYSEMPISEEIVRAFVLGAGGTILACRTALGERTFAMNLAGGFHHAFPDWAEGFCYINDVAVGVRRVIADGVIGRAMVVDCDLHQGNGTAYVFAEDPSVFTLSIHEENLYPAKRQSDVDLGLPAFCGGDVYLPMLQRALGEAMDGHEPEFVLYVAGADPYAGDQLGTLALSIEELKRRDEIVLGACAERGIPAAITLAGGYAPRVEDTVTIHYGTALTAAELAPQIEATDA